MPELSPLDLTILLKLWAASSPRLKVPSEFLSNSMPIPSRSFIIFIDSEMISFTTFKSARPFAVAIVS